ncbi:hypothetical protein NDU88_006707 [Pleurodeles waltl]|uniref:Uncharacterized protein n=1 Tax=Pleurodeles waltl TaxID=8319 RepID=A0AAV7X2C0_PLEWA|nr:hypothetical protein NDU88_006707 [Pleurodeles waltl]
MGASGRKEVDSNRRAPAHRSIQQGFVRRTRPALCAPGSPPGTSGRLRRTRRGRGVEPLPHCWRRDQLG